MTIMSQLRRALHKPVIPLTQTFSKAASVEHLLTKILTMKMIKTKKLPKKLGLTTISTVKRKELLWQLIRKLRGKLRSLSSST